MERELESRTSVQREVTLALQQEKQRRARELQTRDDLIALLKEKVEKLQTCQEKAVSLDQRSSYSGSGPHAGDRGFRRDM